MNKNNTRIDIRCTKQEKETLKVLAKDRGMTVSEFVKSKLFGRKITVRYLDQGTEKQAKYTESEGE
jgi:hypothetical protein